MLAAKNDRRQVSHQWWLKGIRPMQAMKHASEVANPNFQTQSKHHQKSNKEVPIKD